MIAKAENAEVRRSRVAAARCAQLAEPAVHERTHMNLTGRRGWAILAIFSLSALWLGPLQKLLMYAWSLDLTERTHSQRRTRSTL